MSAAPALSVEGVSKTYVVGRPAYGSLRDWLGRPSRRQPMARREVHALRDVSLSIAPGETLGLIGANGAGKSTLLKVVARITPPDAGRVAVRGRASSLIELGAGFHPELTGAENVVLHGTILGHRPRDLRRDLDEIAAFAGLTDQMHVPVKHFSTGMYARLGFAVAVYADPDVLLVDEVLAVGDLAFRARCLERIARLQAGGGAVLFVSHDLDTVQAACSRVGWLDGGCLRALGAPDRVVAAYRADSNGT